MEAKFSLKHAIQKRNEPRFASFCFVAKTNLRRNRRTLFVCFAKM
jgi:hypothetical protein